jgi:hypothetical protein
VGESHIGRLLQAVSARQITDQPQGTLLLHICSLIGLAQNAWHGELDLETAKNLSRAGGFV